MIALAPKTEILYYVAFVDRGEVRRIISHVPFSRSALAYPTVQKKVTAAGPNQAVNRTWGNRGASPMLRLLLFSLTLGCAYLLVVQEATLASGLFRGASDTRGAQPDSLGYERLTAFVFVPGE